MRNPQRRGTFDAFLGPRQLIFHLELLSVLFYDVISGYEGGKKAFPLNKQLLDKTACVGGTLENFEDGRRYRPREWREEGSCRGKNQEGRSSRVRDSEGRVTGRV